MSINNPVQPPQLPLLPAPPPKPTNEKDILAWHNYRDNWQQYPDVCRAFWEQNNLTGGEIDYWTSLREAQDTYRVTRDTNHRKAQDDYRKYQEAYYNAQDEYYKAQIEYCKARDANHRVTRDANHRVAQEAYHPYKQALDREEKITRWKYLADADYAYQKAKEAKKLGRPKKAVTDEWLEYFRAWLDYRKSWCKHWDALGWPWRTEPEIDDNCQNELNQCLANATESATEKGDYPFKGMKLTRAEVEWLLATHKNEFDEKKPGPVDWGDKNQRERKGLDLRGANLRDVNLSGLPLASMLGGLAESERGNDGQWQCRCQEAAVRFEDTTLFKTDLEGAQLQFAHLQRANLDTVHLERVKLYRAHLEGANLRYAYFDRTTNLDSMYLDGANVADVRWGEVNLSLVAWERVEKLGDELEAEESEKNIHMMKASEDEQKEWLRTFRRAIRANRQVAIILKDQGLDEVADDFDYRALILQRKLLYRQGWWGRRGLLGTSPTLWQRIGMIVSSRVSWLLNFVAGYGYRPWRWLIIYLLALLGFTVAHYIVGGNITWLNAFSMSILNLHGRPFLTSSQDVQGVQGSINTIEAFVGLLIEAVLIAIIVKSIMGRSGG